MSSHSHDALEVQETQVEGTLLSAYLWGSQDTKQQILVYEPDAVVNNSDWEMREETSFSSLVAVALSQCLDDFSWCSTQCSNRAASAFGQRDVDGGTSPVDIHEKKEPSDRDIQLVTSVLLFVCFHPTC
jgi:hypothetical protein